MMHGNRIRFLLAGGLLLLAACASIVSARAAESPGTITLEAVPAAIKLGPLEKGRIAVIARNNSEAPVRVIKLDYIASDGLSLKVPSSDPETSVIVAGSTLRWVIEIAQTADAHDAGEIQFLLDYSPTETTGDVPVSKTVRATTTVQRVQPGGLDKVLEARTESAMKMLEDPNSGAVFVVVRNKSNFPISIRSIDVVASAEVDTSWKGGAKTTLVPPQCEQAFEAVVKAKDVILPGKYLLLFTVNAEWNEEGSPRTGSTVVKYEFDAGILGNSAMLTAVGVPTFLLLPGFLMIIIFATLWKWWKERTAIPLDVKAPQFWALAVILSLTTALFYPILTGRNYLKGYNFRDVCYVWFGSAGAALFACLFLVLVLKAVRALREAKARQRRFSSADSPMDVLRKLALNNAGFKLKQGQITRAGKLETAFVLPENPGAGPTVAPVIELSTPSGFTGDLERELEGLLAQYEATSALIDFIDQWKITARWREGPLGGVVAVSQVGESADLPAASLVELV